MGSDAATRYWIETISELKSRMAAQEAATAERIERLTSRVDEHAARLTQTATASEVEIIAGRQAVTAGRLDQVVAVLDHHDAKLAAASSNTQLAGRMAEQEAATTERLNQIVARLDEHEARLADIPTTPQLVAAMEQLLGRTMTTLDERLATQARSIEVLTTTVSQTDSLLEKVLESLDTLQTVSDTDAEPAPPRKPPIQEPMDMERGFPQVAFQKAGQLPKSVRSSLEYLLGRPLGPDEDISVAAASPQASAARRFAG